MSKEEKSKIITSEQKGIPLERVNMVHPVSANGSEFSYLTHANNQCILDRETGEIHFNHRGKACGMSMHSAAIANWVFQ